MAAVSEHLLSAMDGFQSDKIHEYLKSLCVESPDRIDEHKPYFMNAADIINRLTQLPQSERITLARKLLPLEPPREGTQIDLSHALSFVAQLPPKYRQSMISLLSASDKASNGNSLDIEDAINMAHTLLMLTQNHGALDVGTGIPASIPHDFILEAGLQKLLNGWDCSKSSDVKVIGTSSGFPGIPGA